MKKLLLIFSVFIILHSKTEAQFGGGGYISFQTFYDQLSPYGIWAYSPQYGYVWAPNVGRSFKPYGSNGRWAYTHYGWTWVSNYRWGWAPFHYGRWIYDDWRGWFWVPGYEWAPAWVAWGYYGGNYGWAPLAPGININANFGWRPPSGWWTFVPGNRFGGNNWNHYAIRNNRNITVNNITIINNVYNGSQGSNRVQSPWMRGPEARDVERATNTRIRPMEITDARDPSADRVSNNRIAIYRPAVDRKAEGRPGNIEDMEKVRPVTKLPERDPGNNLRPVKPVDPRPVDPSPVTRPVTPSPRPRPVNPAPVTRPVNPSPKPVTPSPKPVTQNPKPQPTPRPVTRPAEPQPEKPTPKPVTRPVDKSKPTPAPRRSVQ